MTEPTPENIDEVISFRLKAIQSKPVSQIGALQDPVEWVRQRAQAYADRPNHSAKTAQEAVTWALADL